MAIYNLGRIDGLSAYEVWLENGNEGTEEEFLASLKGDKGDTGEQGPQGPAGADGFSPTAIVEQTDTGAKITITDKNGTTTATVNHGQDGTGGSGGITSETDPIYTADKPNIALKSEIPDITTKQDTLVSGTNIKTINGQSVLGSGNITIEGGSNITLDTAMSDTSENAVQNKVIKAYVDGLVGNIETLLINLDSGNGVQ